jgi:hypothetical protein
VGDLHVYIPALQWAYIGARTQGTPWTRTCTITLRAWFEEHDDNPMHPNGPYPTPAEKEMLARLAKVTVSQTNNWSAWTTCRKNAKH